MSSFVLDASALLVLLGGEPGSADVETHLSESVMSAVNFAEVVGKLAERGIPEIEIQDSLGALGLEILPFDREMAQVAGLFRRETRERGLSLGDRACLALGMKLGATVLTADHSWKGLKIGVKIREIR